MTSLPRRRREQLLFGFERALLVPLIFVESTQLFERRAPGRGLDVLQRRCASVEVDSLHRLLEAARREVTRGVEDSPRARGVPFERGLVRPRFHQERDVLMDHEVPRVSVAYRPEPPVELHGPLQRGSRGIGPLQLFEHPRALDLEPRRQLTVSPPRRGHHLEMLRERVERRGVLERARHRAQRRLHPPRARQDARGQRQEVAKRLHRLFGRGATRQQKAPQFEQTQGSDFGVGGGSQFGFEQREGRRDGAIRREPAGRGDGGNRR